jgi:hypothetical protein
MSKVSPQFQLQHLAGRQLSTGFTSPIATPVCLAALDLVTAAQQCEHRQPALVADHELAVDQAGSDLEPLLLILMVLISSAREVYAHTLRKAVAFL